VRHGTARRRRRLARIPCLAEIRDLAPVRQEQFEYRPLVLLPAPHQVVESEVDSLRRPEHPSRRPRIRLCQHLAGQEVRDIARRHPYAALDDLHRPSRLAPRSIGRAIPARRAHRTGDQECLVRTVAPVPVLDDEVLMAERPWFLAIRASVNADLVEAWCPNGPGLAART
jgi:hypothetical protein